MDVIYPYRRAPDDYELRYSLRSLANLTHGRVIVAGDKPTIASGKVQHIPVARMQDRYRSSTTNIMSAIEMAGVSGEFVVMHDDIFLLAPWVRCHEHRGSIDDYLASNAASGAYRQVLRTTQEMLRTHGVHEPMFFGLHTPAVYDACKFRELVREFAGKRYLARTLYFNLFPRPAVRRDDVKVKQWGGAPRGAVLSISDEVGCNPRFRSWIEARFPIPSVYERDAPMKKEMIANKAMTYATRRLSAGEVFTASVRDADLLARLGRAREYKAEDLRDDVVAIPRDWAELGWPALKSLAASVSPSPVKSKDDAISAIEAELKRRGA